MMEDQKERKSQIIMGSDDTTTECTEGESKAVQNGGGKRKESRDEVGLNHSVIAQEHPDGSFTIIIRRKVQPICLGFSIMLLAAGVLMIVLLNRRYLVTAICLSLAGVGGLIFALPRLFTKRVAISTSTVKIHDWGLTTESFATSEICWACVVTERQTYEDTESDEIHECVYHNVTLRHRGRTEKTVVMRFGDAEVADHVVRKLRECIQKVQGRHWIPGGANVLDTL